MNYFNGTLVPDDSNMKNSQDVRSHFAITQNCAYLNNASVAPISTFVAAAMAGQASHHAAHVDTLNRDFEAVYQETREAVARLVGSQASRVAFIQNTSHGISLIANGQPWKAGDNVVISSQEFPSNYLAWERLAVQGVEIRKVELDNDRLTPEQISSAVDSMTRLVSISEVQYFNGYRVDLAAISQICRDADAFLVVDGTQSIGALEIDVDSLGVDAIVVSAHKWMLGPLGIGFMALSDRLLAETEVTQIGWLSVNDPFDFKRVIDLPVTAEKFECGTENSAGLLGLLARIREIEVATQAGIQASIFELCDSALESLSGHGLEPTLPQSEQSRSGIVSFRGPILQQYDVVSHLAKSNVVVSQRNGALRVSPHYFNNIGDISQLCDAIGELDKR